MALEPADRRREPAFVAGPMGPLPVTRTGGRRRGSREASLLPGRIGDRLGLAALALGLPIALARRQGAVVIGLPLRLLPQILAPVRRSNGQDWLRLVPVGGEHRMPLDRRLVEAIAAVIIARCIIEPRPVIIAIVRNESAGGVVDHRQAAIIIAITPVRIADEVGIVLAGAVEIIAIAVGERLDEQHRIVIT